MGASHKRSFVGCPATSARGGERPLAFRPISLKNSETGLRVASKVVPGRRFVSCGLCDPIPAVCSEPSHSRTFSGRRLSRRCFDPIPSFSTKSTRSRHAASDPISTYRRILPSPASGRLPPRSICSVMFLPGCRLQVRFGPRGCLGRKGSVGPGAYSQRRRAQTEPETTPQTSMTALGGDI